MEATECFKGAAGSVLAEQVLLILFGFYMDVGPKQIGLERQLLVLI